MLFLRAPGIVLLLFMCRALGIVLLFQWDLGKVLQMFLMGVVRSSPAVCYLRNMAAKPYCRFLWGRYFFWARYPCI